MTKTESKGLQKKAENLLKALKTLSAKYHEVGSWSPIADVSAETYKVLSDLKAEIGWWLD
ncbi:MAG TPA: hypothetical protein VMI32_13340 [Candidatus Solibacter sp.]|nr:hypothetical protein [Candidatus Solibacter sp.]